MVKPPAPNWEVLGSTPSPRADALVGKLAKPPCLNLGDFEGSTPSRRTKRPWANGRAAFFKRRWMVVRIHSVVLSASSRMAQTVDRGSTAPERALRVRIPARVQRDGTLAQRLCARLKPGRFQFDSGGFHHAWVVEWHRRTVQAGGQPKGHCGFESRPAYSGSVLVIL